jgi:two-component system cell cycle sensor histidine kinase PleC
LDGSLLRAAEAGTVNKVCDPVTLEVLQANVKLLAENERLEHERRRLLDLDRMKTEFLARISHDLRTPLNSIIGFSDLITAEIGGRVNKKHGEFIAAIHRNGHALLVLINELLDLSSLESGQVQLKRERVPLVTVLDDLVAATGPVLAAARIEVGWPAAAALAGQTALIDRRRVVQALVNLIDNARKYTPAGGTVRVEIASDADEAVFVVADTGPGIPPAERERIFLPYYQRSQAYAPNAGGGVGLGLAIVKSIVAGHGGRLELDSDIGRGCRFRLRLPQRQAQAAGEGKP